MLRKSFPVVGLTALLFTTVLAGCGSDSSAVEHPDSVVDAGRPPGYVFESLPRLVATSELVVLGTVQSAEKGKRVVPDDPLRHRKIVVEVEEQFHGPSVESTIVIHEGGYNGEKSYELSEQPWLYPGDRAVYFLAHPPNAKPNHYEIIAPSGRFAIADDNTISSEATDPIARQLDGISWSKFTHRLRGKVQTARQQDVQPLPPGPFGEIERQEGSS